MMSYFQDGGLEVRWLPASMCDVIGSLCMMLTCGETTVLQCDGIVAQLFAMMRHSFGQNFMLVYNYLTNC